MGKLLLLGLAGATVFYSYLLLAEPEVPDLAFPDSAEAIARGEYLVAAGGCVSCHQAQGDTREAESSPATMPAMSGGLALESEFGTFFVPNITPDPQTGIGNWTGRDLLAAMKHGRSPSGSYYYPAFPYRAYAGLSDEEVLDIGAFLTAQPAIVNEVPENETPAWLSRWMLAGWNMLASISEPDTESFDDPQLARGHHLASNLGHCAECHTPRNALGILDSDRSWEGGPFEDGTIEPIDQEGLAGWTEEDFAFFLFLGMKPDGEFVGGKMESVIEHNTSRLTEEDQQAMAAYFIRGRRLY